MWLLCVKEVRNVVFVCERGQKMWLLCLKMRVQIWEMRVQIWEVRVQIWEVRAQIWGYLGQMAHRRQIAQWSGTRTTHSGGTGFETGPAPN